MRYQKIFIGIIAGALIAGAALAMSADSGQVKGAAEMVLTGGKRGDVPFPHQRHQEILVDCNSCHAVFPQEKGAIDALKAEGKLKPKHVMNKQCTKCHKEKKRAGEKAGPTTCTACHKKNKG